MKRIFPTTINGLALSVDLLLGIGSLVLSFAIYRVTHEAVEGQLDRRIETEADILSGIHAHDGVDELIEEIGRRELRSRVTGMGYIYARGDGVRLSGALNAPVPAPGWQEFLYDDEGGGHWGVSQALTKRLPDGSILVVAADRTPVDEMDRALFILFGLVFVAMLILGTGGALALGALIRQRLGQIDATAHAIIKGDLARRIPVDGSGSEFDRLAETLNRMLDRNAELVSNVQQVSNDIAHDLRTPLTRLQQVLDDAVQHAHDLDAFRLAITTASDRSQELQDLFNALLRISEIETHKVRAQFKPTDLVEVVDRVIDAFRPDLEAKGLTVFTLLEPGCYIDGDRHLLSQLLVNLIENVLRHTPGGTRLGIRVSRGVGFVCLLVSDTGGGIPSEDRERVLKRFARLETSRSTSGFGLGLSLVAAIARAHHAEPELSDNSPGLRVELRFPVTPSLQGPVMRAASPVETSEG